MAPDFQVHLTDTDVAECLYSAGHGPHCANPAHYRIPTYDDWARLQGRADECTAVTMQLTQLLTVLDAATFEAAQDRVTTLWSLVDDVRRAYVSYPPGTAPPWLRALKEQADAVYARSRN